MLNYVDEMEVRHVLPNFHPEKKGEFTSWPFSWLELFSWPGLSF
jgi:hypothetical protein